MCLGNTWKAVEMGVDTVVWTQPCSDSTGQMAQTWRKMVLACLVLGSEPQGGLKAGGEGLEEARWSPGFPAPALGDDATPPSMGLGQRTPSA